MNRRSTRTLAIASMLTALQVVVLYFASFFSLIDLSLTAFTAFIAAFSVREIKGKWSAGIFVATSILSLLLLPNRFPAVVYIGFFGWYPILKLKCDRLPKIISYLIKFAVFNVSFASVILVCKYLLALEDMQGFSPAVYYTVMFLIGNIAFVLFDTVLKWLMIIYDFRLRKRLRIDKFFK